MPYLISLYTYINTKIWLFFLNLFYWSPFLSYQKLISSAVFASPPNATHWSIDFLQWSQRLAIHSSQTPGGHPAMSHHLLCPVDVRSDLCWCVVLLRTKAIMSGTSQQCQMLGTGRMQGTPGRNTEHWGAIEWEASRPGFQCWVCAIRGKSIKCLLSTTLSVKWVN